jgi:transposase-like protein
MPYSLDLRKRIVAAVNNGMTKSKACLTFNICRQTLYNWLALEKSEGHLKPQTGFQKGHSHGIKDLDKFSEFVDLHPDYTQEEKNKHDWRIM